MMLDRTQFMMQTMQEHMEGHDTLTVIGLEHLYGGSGLLAEFEKGGYTVTKVV